MKRRTVASKVGKRWPLLAMGGIYAAALVATSVWWTDWTARQTWAVALTGLVLIWYAWEAMQLRQATFAQRELQLRPLVVLEPEKNSFRLRNFGHGTALNISIDDVIVSEQEEIVIRFPQVIPVLPAGATAEVRAESFKKGRLAGDFFLAHLDPEYASLDLRVCVHFQNAEMAPYMVTESIRPGELSITDVSTSEAL